MSEASSLTLTKPEPDIALLTFDMPNKGANILSSVVLDELESRLDELAKDEGLEGLIIASAKPGIFIAGADIGEFAANLDIESSESEKICRRGQTLFARLANTPFVTVAAIDGMCVGGGAELAIWCDRRVVADNAKTQFGFPEVKLGLFPGWGGTARTPRIIGLSNAVEMITGGESVDAAAAVGLGIATDMANSESLLEVAINLVREERLSGRYFDDRVRWSRPIAMSETEIGFLGITASGYIRSQTGGKYPAPEAALDTMLESAAADLDEACKIEARGMSQLFGSPVNAALINVFMLTDRNKKDTGVSAEVAAEKVNQVGVIGAGIMGAGIVAANLKRNLTVCLADASQESLEKGSELALEEAAYDRTLEGANVDRLLELSSKLNLTSTDGLKTCELVVEAIVENADVKRQVFERLEPQLAESAILASNTSTIPITSLASKLKRPEQFCGIHFFNPVRRMKLVEIIRGKLTSDSTIATAVAYAKQLGKMPIVVNDGPGFLVNRLLLPYMNEALELLSDGAAIKDIERASKSFGMPMGPLALYDMVGIDTAFYAGRTMWEAYPDRIVASPILPALVKSGRLGQKSGRGFFNYENRKKKPEPDPAFDDLLRPYLRKETQFDTGQIRDRLFLTMLLEATRALEEGIVRDPRDVDLGMIFGLGFPPFKGGLLFWADQVGAASIVESLKPLKSLGKRAEPTELLLEMARDHRKFYDMSPQE